MSDDYPTAEDIDTVTGAWHMDGYPDITYHRIVEAFAVLRALWWNASVLWSEGPATDDGQTGIRYEFSTGGWSGNEELIDAVTGTNVWLLTWEQSRRGGHYEFFLPDRWRTEP